LFKHDWKENDGEIEIKDVNPSAFSAMMEAMYTMEYTAVNGILSAEAVEPSLLVFHLKVSNTRGAK